MKNVRLSKSQIVGILKEIELWSKFSDLPHTKSNQKGLGGCRPSEQELALLYV
jgi:hypothetical protein